MRASKSSYAVVAAALLCLGAAAGMLAVTLPKPASLEAPAETTVLPVSERSFSDERAVGVAVEYGPARALTSGRTGIVTASTCEKGAALTSGSAPFSVDGSPVIALATSVPLWRDLAIGAKGSDVVALRTELARLGAGVEPGDTVNRATLLAFRQLVVNAGGTAAAVESISLGAVAWLPAPSIIATECPVAVGSQVGQGGALAGLPSLVLGARVSPLPDDLAEGQRLVRIDDQEFAVDAEGAFAPVDLDRLAATPAYAAARQVSDAEKIKASLLLTEPVQVYPVPPRAIIEAGGSFCVIDGGSPTKVDVLASQLGQSFVRPTGEGAALSEIALDPPSKTTCG
ncbi:hypothetical protein GCM10009651_29890 [Microbacterium natoriense]